MKKILVAGQPIESFERLTLILENADSEIFTAVDTGSAVRLLEREILIDLVVLTDFAEVEDGYLLLKNIRQDPIFKEVPVVVINERTDRETVIRFLHLGVQNYLVQSSPEEKIVAAAKKAMVENHWRAKLCPKLVDQHSPTGISPSISLKRHRETLAALTWFLPKLVASLENEDFTQGNTAVRIFGFLAKEIGIPVLKDLIVDFSMLNREVTRKKAAYILTRIEILRRLLFKLIGNPGSGSEPPPATETAPKIAPCEVAVRHKKPAVTNVLSLDRSGAEIFEAISRISHLPVMEPVLSFIQDWTRRGQIGLDDAVDYVKMEPGLCLQFLSLANSTYFAPKSSIQDLTSALHLIGTGNLEDTLSKTKNITPFEKLFTSLDGQAFWVHQVGTARLCERINDMLDMPKYPDAYMAGLLHDVGKTILAHLFPEKYNAVLAHSRREVIPLTEAEYSCFAMTHEEAGAAFIEKQNLPGTVKSAVRFHRFPEKAVSGPEIASLVNVANFLCKKLGVGASGADFFKANNEVLKQPGWAILRKYLHPRVGDEDFAHELIEQAAKLEQEVELAVLHLA